MNHWTCAIKATLQLPKLHTNSVTLHPWESLEYLNHNQTIPQIFSPYIIQSMNFQKITSLFPESDTFLSMFRLCSCGTKPQRSENHHFVMTSS